MVRSVFLTGFVTGPWNGLVDFKVRYCVMIEPPIGRRLRSVLNDKASSFIIVIK